jgi:hypothetical protein
LIALIGWHPTRVPAFLQIPSTTRLSAKKPNHQIHFSHLEIPAGKMPTNMATPNYAFEKRRRELDKKAKKEEKRKHKLEAAAAHAPEHDGEASEPAATEAPSPEAPTA